MKTPGFEEGVIHESPIPLLRKILFFIVLPLILFAGAGCIWWISYSTDTKISETPGAPEKIPPTGTIYMTLTKLPAGTAPLGIYAFDIDTNSISPVVVQDDPELVTSKFSPDKSQVAYATIPGVRGADIGRLFVADSNFKNPDEIVSNENLVFRRNPDWSPKADLLAYHAKKDAYEGDMDLEKWEIYVTNPNTKVEHFLTYGKYPTFTPNGDLLLLKNNGLYLYKHENFFIENPIGIQVWDMETGAAVGNMSIDVSLDGKYLAWSLFDQGELWIIEITSWDSFTGRVIHTIKSAGFWPVFSPDSQYVAFQEVDSSTSAENPRLVIFDLESAEKIHLASLGDFYQEAMFITDWK